MSFERAQSANMSCEATSDVERGARRVPGELNGTNLGFEKVRPSGLTEDERQRTARTVRFMIVCDHLSSTERPMRPQLLP